MSKQSYNANIAVLGKRIQGLTKQVVDFTRAKEKKQKITAIAGTILAVAVGISLAGLTSMSKKLDAEAVAQISRAQVEQRLPEARQKVQAYLEQEAPRLVGHTLRSMIDMLPELRRYMMRDLNQRMDLINAEFEKKTIGLMAHAVQSAKQDIDRVYPDLGDREKLQRLVEAVALKFNENIAEMTLALYPDYKAEMSRITAYLDDLKHKEPASLTEEERIQREIIETLLQLIAREQRQRKQG